MQQGFLDIARPGVQEALLDDDAMRCWEQLRSADEALSPAALAASLGVELGAVHRSLDLLQVAGLARKLPATSKRRAVAYAVTTESIVVVVPDDEVGRGMCRVLASAITERQRRVLLQAKSYGNRLKGEWYFEQITEFVATAEEIREIQRRLYELSRYVIEVAERRRTPGAAAGESEDGVTVSPMRVHAAHLRVVPITGELKPMPQIRLLTSAAVRDQERESRRPTTMLADREREIGALLQSGLARADIAAKLGISVQTVSSHCKRIYEKLGISRAISLQHFDFTSKAKGGRRGARDGG